MVQFAKLGAYAAWIAVAVVAAAARPAAADPFDRYPSPPRSSTFNEAWSFADADEPLPSGNPDAVAPRDERQDQRPSGPTATAAAALLVGTWAWQGVLEGLPTYMETAFYPDGTYESVAQTPVLRMYEAGYWALVDGLLRTEVVQFEPRVIRTPYGPQPVPYDTEYTTALAFLDEDTIEIEIGLAYRID
jgi:hypothetical protein